MASRPGKQTITIHIWSNNSVSKGNQTIKYGQLTKYKATFTLIYILPNTANPNNLPFQVKINCSKFKIDGLQLWCHMTLLVFSFVTSRKLLCDVFLPRKIITILTYKK